MTVGVLSLSFIYFQQIVTQSVITFDGSSADTLMQVPSQLAILAVQVWCTRLIDAALSSSHPEDLQSIQPWLLQVQQKMRQSSDRAHQLTGETMALTALYYRDLIDCILQEQSRHSWADSKTWHSSLKYRVVDGQVEIHVCDLVLRYGLEYIGQPPPMIDHSDLSLVVSTVANTLNYHALGCLVGPLRLELMETLARCTGQRLGLFDCSSLTTTDDILRQLRGTITCGTWLCYNQIHLLRTSVSSYLCSLLTQLLNRDSLPAWLELPDLGSVPPYGLFGFAPSEKAADIIEPNLKRAVYVHLPDVGHVAEILFPGRGQDLLTCLQRFWDTYDPLLSRDGQSQLETLRQIARMARGETLLEAIMSWGSSRISVDQTAEFRQTIETTLGQDSQPLSSGGACSKPLVDACKAATESLGLHFTERLLWKVSNVSNAYRHRIPVLVLGPSRSGKTSLLRIFCATQSTVTKQQLSIEHICTGAFDEDALMSNTTHSIIPQMIRGTSSSSSRSTPAKMLVLDGEFIDGVQDRLLDALSKERVLCLRSTEQMVLPDNVYFAFEMSGAASHAISPHHIARCRLISLDQGHVTWSCLVKSWLKTAVPPVFAFLEQLFVVFLPPLIEFNVSLEHQTTAYHSIKAVSHMLPLITALIQPCSDSLAKTRGVVDTETRTYVQGAVVFALIWTLGVPGYMQKRDEFHDLFYDLLEDALDQNLLLNSVRIPTQGCVFDYKLMRDAKTVWQPWSDDLKASHSLSRELPTNELFIPTVESVRVQHLMSLFISAGVPCVVIGATAVGKTATVMIASLHALLLQPLLLFNT